VNICCERKIFPFVANVPASNVATISCGKETYYFLRMRAANGGLMYQYKFCYSGRDHWSQLFSWLCTEVDAILTLNAMEKAMQAETGR
jgi:hypothetical protein